jgi:hypothetical protein
VAASGLSPYAARVGRLENTFSWSNSRAATFDRCLRSYWWQYYGAWGGWERGAPAKTRLAYVLKNLTSRWAWVGSSVHEAIESILKDMHAKAMHGQLQFGESGPDVEHEVEKLTESMRTQYRQSLTKRYVDNPKRNFGLMEHEYDDPVSRDEWKKTSEKARTALRSFLTSEVFAHIAASDPRGWLPIEHLDQFHLDGVGIWAAPDFALRLEDGHGELYDWKTGAVHPERSRLQMACYTLYMEEKHGVAPARLRNHLVYLGEAVEVHDSVFSTEELRAAREEIRVSMTKMQTLLTDAERNVADAASFPLTDDLDRCRTCVFRRLCDR